MRVETPQIYSDLQRKLMTATFPPGQKLKPAELQAIYGCSANTVRDVLLQLSKVGLVDFEMQRGFRVREATDERRRDVTRFRIMLEQEGARLSMQHGSVEWEARLSAAHHKLNHIQKQVADASATDRDLDLWAAAELEFHETLMSNCGSAILRETYEDVYAQFRQQITGNGGVPGGVYFAAIVLEHQAIVDAALARDVEGCRAAIHEHLSRHL